MRASGTGERSWLRQPRPADPWSSGRESSGRPGPPRVLILLFALQALFAHSGVAQSQGERDTGFLLTLERSAEAPSGLVVRLVTTSSYPCEGYQIRSRVVFIRDTASITITGLLRPSPCFQTHSEATGTAYLGQPRVFPFVLKIVYRGDADLYRVFLTARGGISASAVKTVYTRLVIRG